jgi:hypothetical protein
MIRQRLSHPDVQRISAVVFFRGVMCFCKTAEFGQICFETQMETFHWKVKPFGSNCAGKTVRSKSEMAHQ